MSDTAEDLREDARELARLRALTSNTRAQELLTEAIDEVCAEAGMH